jgi:transposase-like protein
MSGVLRQVMAQDVPVLLSGVVEVDETYIGAQWRNRPWSVRKHGTKKGRGTSKQAIFGIHERTRGVVRAFFVPNVRSGTLLPLIRKHVAPGSTIYSDAYQLYQNVVKDGYRHAFVDHARHEYARGPVNSNGMEGFWGVLKRRLKTTGGIRLSRLPHYVAEEVWRYNFRSLSETEKVERLLDLLQKVGG